MYLQAHAINSEKYLEQLLTAIQQLDEAALAQVAQAVADRQTEARLAHWIEVYADPAPAGFLDEAGIDAEINAALQLSG